MSPPGTPPSSLWMSCGTLRDGAKPTRNEAPRCRVHRCLAGVTPGNEAAEYGYRLISRLVYLSMVCMWLVVALGVWAKVPALILGPVGVLQNLGGLLLRWLKRDMDSRVAEHPGLQIGL